MNTFVIKKLRKFLFKTFFLIISLALLIKEIQISSKALEYHLSDIEDHLKKNKS